jgi:hypothetical protein
MSVPSSVGGRDYPGSGGGDFRIGDVLSRAWTILSNNLLFFIGLSALVYVVMIAIVVLVVLMAVATGQFGRGGFGALVVLLGIISALAVIVVSMVGQAAMLFGAFQYLRGLPVRMGESLSRAFTRIGPLIGATLLVSICVGFGLLALLVPGIILFCMWAVVIPVCVVEGSGPTASMSRSAALTKGHRWKVFGIFLLIWLISVAIQVVQVVLAQVSSVLASLFSLGAGVVLAAYIHCIIIMIYHDLRVAKEGVDTTQIASVFD